MQETTVSLLLCFVLTNSLLGCHDDDGDDDDDDDDDDVDDDDVDDDGDRIIWLIWLL